MRGHLLALCSCLVCSVGVATAASADGDEFYSRNGAYLAAHGLNAVQNFEQFRVSNADGEVFAVEVADRSSFGASGRFGYRFHRRLAAEFQLEWLREFGAEDVALPGVEMGEITHMLSYTANLKGFILTGALQPYLLAGIGGGQALFRPKRGLDPDRYDALEQDRRLGFVARVGGGVDFYVNSFVGITAEAAYVLPAGDIKELDYASFLWGFFLRF